MKISEFLRMNIKPDDEKFDLIKNVKFLDDKSKVLVGNGTVTVRSFCDAFFDYVYRNFNSSRGAEKLIKSNRKKYGSFNGSESMILVQRILREICEDYAIGNYSITCEIDTQTTTKKAGDKAKQQAANIKPQSPKAVQETKPVQNNGADNAVQPAETKKSEENINSDEQEQPVRNVQPVKAEEPVQPSKTEQPDKQSKQQAPAQNVQPAQNAKPVQDHQQSKPVQQVKPVQQEAGIQGQKNVQAQHGKPLGNNMNQGQQARQGKNHPVDSKKMQALSSALEKMQPQQHDNTSEINAVKGGNTSGKNEIEKTPMENIRDNLRFGSNENAVVISSEKNENKAENVDVPKGVVMIDGKPVPIKAESTAEVQERPEEITVDVQKDVEDMGLTGFIIAAGTGEDEVPVIEKEAEVNRDKKNKMDFQDPRMKPGKGIPPMKELKPFTKENRDGGQNSKTRPEDVECIAIIPDNRVPSMDEVPFIGIPEDNSVPILSEVPFIGVDIEPGAVFTEDSNSKTAAPVQPEVNTEPEVITEPEAAAAEPEVVAEPVAVAEEHGVITEPEAAAAEPEVIAEPEAVAEEPEVTVEPEAVVVESEAVSEPETVATEPEVAEESEVITEPEAAVEEPEVAAEHETVADEPEVQSAVTEPERGTAPVFVKTSERNPVQHQEQASKKIASKRTIRDIKKIISSGIENNKQVVFTGPSGTGKTYQIRKYVRRASAGYDGCRFVQFHPSYEYSDFIEGMRPANILKTSAPTNVRLDGMFKAFCRIIVEDNLECAVSGFASMYAEKKQKVVQKLYENIRDRREAIDEGTEKEFFAPDSQEYIFENGVRDYYFIIDELNRADVVRVFGDVLFALDEDYRGIENRFDTRLGNLKTYRIIQAEDMGKANYTTSHIGYAEQMKFDCFEKGFFIPKNLHIIGTMNEIENSVDSIGFAFKHRFRWIDIDPEEIMYLSLKDMHKDKDIFWLDRFSENLNMVNRLIGESFSNEYRIGPAYFRKLDESSESINRVFDTTIEPLLKEYLKGKPKDITERFITECRRALNMGI